MNRDEILNEPAGRTLDSWVAEEVMGLKLDKHRKGNVLEGNFSIGIRKYSTDISATWGIINSIKTHWIFSNRQRFFKNLTEIIYSKNGVVVGWPDALIFMEPHHICRAALLTTLGE